MNNPHHGLIAVILTVAIVIGLFSYLFHPDVGTFKLIVNDQPVDDAIVRFAAVPSAIIVMLLIGLLAVLLIMGAGALLFLLALFFSMLAVFLIAPFFWPLLLVIFLILALLSATGPPRAGG